MSLELQPVSGWRALASVITEPGATFEQLGDRPPVLPGYLAQMLLTLAGAVMSLPALIAVAEQQAALQGQPAQVAAIAKYTVIGGGVFGALAAPWIAGLILAMVCLFFGQFQDTRSTFSSYFGMIGYARLPLAVGSVLGGLLMRVTGGVGNLTTLSLSPAVLLPDGASPYLTALLGLINPFTLWYYILLAIGFGALHKDKAARGLGLVLTLFAFSALMAIAGVALASRLNPQM